MQPPYHNSAPGCPFSNLLLADYVFVDEHNRHKRLKGMGVPRWLFWDASLTVPASYEGLRGLQTEKDQVRCCHH